MADDNSNIQKMAATALKELGIEVVGFSNGESAVKKMADVKPDLILADVFMPVRDGYELCDWVKKSENFSHIPVFLLVGAFDPLDDHKVQSVKADGIIKKPFVPPDRLITIVQAMLERLAHSKHQESLKETHDHFSQNVPHAEDTQQLSEAEVNAMLTPPAPPEPEPVEYAVRTPQIELGDTNQPAFADMLGDTGPELTATLEPPAEEEAPPQSYDIQEAPRQPTPDMPPIKVDFSGPSEPMELVRDEPVSLPPSLAQGGRLDELVANPNEWVQPTPPPPVEASTPVLEAELPPVPHIRVTQPPPPAPEPPKAEPMGVPSKDLPGLEWSQGHAAAAAEPAPPQRPPVSAPQVIPAAATVNPYVIDEIVDKVMMQLQPQIIHRITTEVGKAVEYLQPRLLDTIQKDVIRPLAEELLRNATKKP